MGSLYTLSRQFSFTHLRDVDIHRASATHAGILRAVAARDEDAAARASQKMMEFLYDFTEARRKPTRAVENKQEKTSARG